MARPLSPLTRCVICTLSCVALTTSTLTVATAARPHGRVAERTQPASPAPTAKLANLPLAFEDRGPQTGYFAHAGAFDLTVTPTATILSAHDGTALRLELARSNGNANTTGIDRLPGVVNYLVGRDKAKWRINVPTYGGVTCAGVYTGIDATYRGEDGKLVWDFVVAPHADPRAIAIDVTGARELTIADDGALVAKTPTGEYREDAPVVYQESSKGRTTVQSRYVLRGLHTFGFEIGAHDPTRPLVIDPTVSFNVPFGGNANTFAFGVAMDTQGNTYIVGTTAATNLPTMGGIDATLGGDSDAFVAKLNPSGALVYSTYLGGSNYDAGQAIAVDATGAAYVTGQTGISDTNDFPVTPGAFQTSFGGGADAYVAKLAPNGASLVYATYLGGTESFDGGTGITVDATGNAYVCGSTVQNFPTVNALQPQPAGSAEGFLSKVSPDGSSLLFSTYLGGHEVDVCTCVSLLGTEECVVAGYTTSIDFPTVNPVQAQNGGFDDAFVAVCDTDGSELTFCTYVGGSQNDLAYGCAGDPAGHVFCDGITYSPDFPVEIPIDTTHCGEGAGACPDGFVCAMDPVEATVDYCTYLGGDGFDECTGIAVDQSGTVLCTGNTTSVDFPVVDPLPGGSGGNGDAFITRIVPGGTAIDFSTLFGGPDGDIGFGIAVNGAGTKAAVAYTGGSTIETGGALGVSFGPRTMADLDVQVSGTLDYDQDGVPMPAIYCFVFNKGPDAAENVGLIIDTSCIVLDSLERDFEVVSQPPPGEAGAVVLRLRDSEIARGSGRLEILRFHFKDDAACGSTDFVCVATTSSIDPNLGNNTATIHYDRPPHLTDEDILFSVTWRDPVEPDDSTPAPPPTDVQLINVPTVMRPGSVPGGIGRRATRTARTARSRPAGASVVAYHVYALAQSNVQPIPANLFTTTGPSQTSAGVSTAPAGSYFVVTAVYDSGMESAASNEVGGTLPVLDKVTVTDKKITATSNGFQVGETVLFAGVPFTTAAKLKKNNTKLVQKGALVIGQTPTQFLQGLVSGSSVVIIFIDTKGNGVGYVYTK